MKLLFVIHSLKFGGAERQLVELIKGLNRLQYDVHLICLDNAAEGYTPLLHQNGIIINYFSRTHKYDFRPIFSIYRYIKEKKIDLVHTFENLGSLYGLLAAKLSGRPVISSAIRNSKDGNFRLTISKKMFAKFADILVSNSKAGLTNRFSRMRPHYRVVYNGMDFSRFKHKQIDLLHIKNELGIAECKYIIGMVASLSTRKDQDTLINAAPLILKSFPDTSFLIIGDGPRRKTLSEKAKQIGLQNNIIFSGNRSDVETLMQIFDIAVLLTNTDIHLEGISNTIIEAMAVGIPVVASKGGGTDEIIKQNVNGLLVPPKNVDKTAEAILELLNDNAKAKRLADAARSLVMKKFNLQRYVKEYEDIYKEVNSKKT